MANSNSSDSRMNPNNDEGPESKRMKVEEADLAKCISQLPNDVVFDYFSSKDMAIAAAVSKDWNKIMSTYPIFHANYFPFEEKIMSDENLTSATEEKVEEWTRKFLRIMENSLLEFCKLYPRGRWNALVVTMRDSFVMHYGNSGYLDRWIKLVVDKNFKELYLNLRYKGFSSVKRYVVPNVILTARSLVALSICSSKLPNIRDHVVIRLDSLRELKLQSCVCDQRSIENLMYACHALRELSIIECCDITELNLPHCKLKKIMVRENIQQLKAIGKIIVRATCLVSFCYFSNTWVDKPCHINLEACKRLESLCLKCVVFPEGFSPNFCEMFPLLRSLILSPAQGLQRVFVISQKLETLGFIHAFYSDKSETLGYVNTRNIDLHRNEDLAEVVIRTPNLKFFKYAGFKLEQLSAFSKFSPYGWIKKIKLYTTENINMDTKWFVTLGDAISQLGSNLTLSLHVKRMFNSSFNLEELGNACLLRLANVEHLKLKALNQKNDLCLLTNPSLMDGLLWSCYPRTLSLSVPLNINVEILKQELLNQKMEQHTCHRAKFRCWRHDLKDAMIEYVVEYNYKNADKSCPKIKITLIW